MSKAHEWQFDGLVGPTHNYAGLSFGNVASEQHKHQIAHPKQAALQGIEKMRMVCALGHKQAFFLPKYSDVLTQLARVGFGGNPAKRLEDAYKSAPELLASLFSSASMWAANAATIAPSMDTMDGKLHIVPANLMSHYHRSLEPAFTTRQLRRIFNNPQYFSVYDPLPATPRFSDEGAANHMRICPEFGAQGLHVFVYGQGSDSNAPRTQRFPARQSEEASRALARLLQLPPERSIFVQQSPHAIDAGVFHHDVIGMNSQLFMAHHADAFVDGKAFIGAVRKYFPTMHIESIHEDFLPMDALVKSYFYNSQLLADDVGNITILAPEESREIAQAHTQFQALLAGRNPVSDVRYMNLRESMKNGGGPACLRLRVVLNEDEAASMHQGIIATEPRLEALLQWVHRTYRETLALDDLRDPTLLREVEEALDALCAMTGMGGLYDYNHKS